MIPLDYSPPLMVFSSRSLKKPTLPPSLTANPPTGIRQSGTFPPKKNKRTGLTSGSSASPPLAPPSAGGFPKRKEAVDCVPRGRQSHSPMRPSKEPVRREEPSWEKSRERVWSVW